MLVLNFEEGSKKIDLRLIKSKTNYKLSHRLVFKIILKSREHRYRRPFFYKHSRVSPRTSTDTSKVQCRDAKVGVEGGGTNTWKRELFHNIKKRCRCNKDTLRVSLYLEH